MVNKNTIVTEEEIDGIDGTTSMTRGGEKQSILRKVVDGDSTSE